MPVALFGIDDGGLNLAVNLLVLFLVVLWIALIAWTYLDARRRIEDKFIVACATAGAVFPFVGAVVYAILRPPEFLEDARERELEIRAAELRVRQLTEQSCPNCEHPIERSFLRCPSCRARLKDPCPSCAKPLDPRWTACPYCEMPIERRRRGGQRRPREEERSGSDSRKRPRSERQPPKRRSAGKRAPEPKSDRKQKQTPARAKAKSNSTRGADDGDDAGKQDSPPTEESTVSGRKRS